MYKDINESCKITIMIDIYIREEESNYFSYTGMDAHFLYNNIINPY